MSFHSQFGEDRWIAENLIGAMSAPQLFCEVGAYDGIQSSNTLYFEEELGWDGICVEAICEIAQQCKKNRKCQTIVMAVGKANGNGLFYVNEQDLGQSGLAVPGKAFIVSIYPLDAILQQYGVPRIDLLSIDTEGTELEVWQTRGPYNPEIVIVEYVSGDMVDRSKEILDRLNADGYKQAHRTEANLIFVKE